MYLRRSSIEIRFDGGNTNMADIPETRQIRTMAVKVVAPLGLPTVAGVAESIVEQALEFCAEKMWVSGHGAVTELLRQGDEAARGYFIYGIAKYVAASLGETDENVRAVYVLDYDTVAEDLCFRAEATGAELIHLLIWTRRKTAALDSLVAAYDRALAQICSEKMGGSGATTVLDAHLVDDVDVAQRRGYGAFCTWVHQRPVQIWER
jgi:hypothetical protein